MNDTIQAAPLLGINYVVENLVPSNYTIDKIIFSFPEYLANVSDIVESTPIDTLQAFFIWQTFQAYQGPINATEVMPYRRFNNILSGLVSLNTINA
jgi:endothelin-converting enzyme